MCGACVTPAPVSGDAADAAAEATTASDGATEASALLDATVDASAGLDAARPDAESDAIVDAAPDTTTARDAAADVLVDVSARDVTSDGAPSMDGGGLSCASADPDDGTAAAAGLGPGSLDCHFRTARSNWSAAVRYCESLGGGYRLVTRAEAARLAERSITTEGAAICRFVDGTVTSDAGRPLRSTPWPSTWTRNCSGDNLAWGVNGIGMVGQYNLSLEQPAVCVRPTVGGDAGAPSDAGVDAGPCQSDASMTCSAPSCDDGTEVARNLGDRSLDCQVRMTTVTWADALAYCASLGGGYRLPTKAEAFEISYGASICRTSLPMLYSTWTSTCAGPGTAWWVYTAGVGVLGRSSTAQRRWTLCIR